MSTPDMAGGTKSAGQDSRYVGAISRRYPKGRPLCGANKRGPEGGTCVKTAGYDTDHPGTGSCAIHGGNTPSHKAAAEKVVAERAAARLTSRLKRFDQVDGADIDYRAEALRLIAFYKHRATEFGRLLQEAYEAAERLRAGHDAGALLASEADDDDPDLPEHPSVQTARHDLERIFLTGGVTAFVGRRWDADRHGRVYAVDEGVTALAKLEQEALRDLRAAIALAKDLKVAEAQIDLAKLVGGLIQAAVVESLRRLHGAGHLAIQPDDPQVYRTIAEAMDAVAPRPVLDGSAS